MKRWMWIMATLVAVFSLHTAWAGGWAVAKLDALPNDVHAGTSLEIGFMLLQHGKTPYNDGTPAVEISTSDSSWQSFPAQRSGADGHYVAQVTFPSAGTWQMRVNPAPFPILEETVAIPITVAPAVVAAEPAAQAVPASAAQAVPAPASNRSMVWLVMAGIVAVAGIATWWLLRGSPSIVRNAKG